MELSVTVLGWKGGEDLTIRFELRLGESREEASVEELISTDYFGEEDIRKWAAASGYEPSLARSAFTMLYKAYHRNHRVRSRCSRPRCAQSQSIACTGMHELAKPDLAHLPEGEIKVKGIGASGQRLPLVTAYRLHLRGQLGLE